MTTLERSDTDGLRPVAGRPARAVAAGPLSEPPARERLLRAAADLFCRRGIHAVGVDAIVEAAGTAKTTLYKLFGSKERLVEAVLEAEGRAWRVRRRAALAARSKARLSSRRLLLQPAHGCGNPQRAAAPTAAAPTLARERAFGETPH